MRTATITERLATDGLQQHLFATPSTVAEACKPAAWSCWNTSECCNGYWCSWRFICERV